MPIPEPPARPSRLWAAATLIALVAVVAFYAHHVLRTFGGATIDDAAISYAYAHNIAHGQGARLTPAASPVEGFSNPLEVISLVPCAWLGADLDTAAKCINVGCVALGLFAWGLYLWRQLRGSARLVAVVPALLTLLWPTFNYWTAAGLEGGMVAGLQMLSVLAMLGQGRGSEFALGTCAGLLAWTRPEGAVYGAIAVLVARRKRALLIFGAWCALLVVARFALFRDWVPNTYWAKVGRPDSLIVGLRYVGDFLANRGGWTLPFFVPLLIPLLPRLRTAGSAAAAQLVFAFAFPILVGGDWMRFWRFLQFAQGPLTALMALGCCAAFAPDTRRLVALSPLTRWGLVLILLSPGIIINRPTEMGDVERAVNGRRDLDMRKIAACGDRYRELGNQLHLGRPLLAADVDMGGLAYPTGLEVLDLGGLGDRVLGFDGTRRPARIVDYVFGERQPDTIHLHGGWLRGRPLHLLSAFGRHYREMGPRMLRDMAMGPITALRADLIDPAAAPVVDLGATVEGITVEGVSAHAENGRTLLFVHATQVSAGPPPNLRWIDGSGRVFAVDWHSGYDVHHGPPGSALVGRAEVGDAKLPLRISDTSVVLDSLPVFDARTDGAASLSRIPLVQRAGVATPDCNPDALLVPTGPARARGLAWLAQLCGAALPAQIRAREAEGMWRQAQQLTDADDRYDSAAVISALAIPMTVEQRLFIERARDAHAAFDEMAQAWSAIESARPASVRPTLSLLIAARAWGEVVQTALARRWTHLPEAAPALCAATRALGFRAGVLPVDCAHAPETRFTITRQDFEKPKDTTKDTTLHLSGHASRWISSRFADVSGGRGHMRLVTNGPGEATWGPFPCPGERFGALVGGTGPGTVVLEARNGQTWIELATIKPRDPDAAQPQLVGLPENEHRDVRVRVIDDSESGGLVVDDIVFFGGEDLSL